MENNERFNLYCIDSPLGLKCTGNEKLQQDRVITKHYIHIEQ